MQEIPHKKHKAIQTAS